jgi:serine/threonine-protein kinase HipA
MNPRQQLIQVFADWQTDKSAQLMGWLTATQLRGKEIFSFEYDSQWLAQQQHIILDPDLKHFTGRQFLSNDNLNFGLFLDSSPDRWGRLLMRRREAALARVENRKIVTLFESDYLLGVYDEHRMGGVRFKVADGAVFQNDNKQMAAPPFTSLRALSQASLWLEKEDSPNSPDYLKWLNMLIAPGSSLGGARPKASVKDPQNHLWIAKFPSSYDDKDTGAWEMLAHKLAIACGITMSEAMIDHFGNKHRTFLTKRFDRRATGSRIHFASAMTLLGFSDGQDHQEGISYLHLAEWLIQNGSNVDADLEQLLGRIIFNICISNTDDHLRNHGFLLGRQGWVLSPAFDLNPIETATGLKLNITENDNALDMRLVLEVAPYFRVSHQKAKAMIENMQAVVGRWRTVANQLGISRNEQEIMTTAFNV